MAKFTNKNFKFDGMYLKYKVDGENRFVARFKMGGMVAFKKFLRENFTVEEYFARIDAGENPTPILESKGYIPSHIKARLRKAGYPTTAAGYKDWWAYQMKLADENMAKRIAREKDMATWTNGRILECPVDFE